MRRRQTKTDVVVEIVDVVVVTVSTARVLTIIVERAAAQHTALSGQPRCRLATAGPLYPQNAVGEGLPPSPHTPHLLQSSENQRTEIQTLTGEPETPPDENRGCR
jgi:hypothetical protein